MGIMEIVLIRHAQSAYNVGKTKHLDSPLTEDGHHQANVTGQFLQSMNWSGFSGFVSPFLRTLQTATILQKFIKVDFEICHEIRELLMEDHVSVSDRSKEFDHFKWLKNEEALFLSEKFETFFLRMQNYLKKRNEEKVVIVTHAALVQTIHDISTNNMSSYESIVEGDSVHNCSITRIINGKCQEFAKVVYEDMV